MCCLWRQVLCVSHPRRAEDLIGDTRIDWRADIRLCNHPDTAISIKDIRSSCVGAAARPLIASFVLGKPQCLLLVLQQALLWT